MKDLETTTDDGFSDEYIILNIPKTSMQVIVKLDEEGLVVDVAECTDVREQDRYEVIASAWVLYSELGKSVQDTTEGVSDKHEELRKVLKDNGSAEYGDIIIDKICYLFDYPTTDDVVVNRREELMDLFTPLGNNWDELMELLEIERKLTLEEDR